MTTILCIDPGAHVGLALFESGVISTLAEMGIGALEGWLNQLSVQVDVVVVEKPWKGTRLLERCGVVVHLARKRWPEARVLRPTPKTWQAFAHVGSVQPDPKDRSVEAVMRHLREHGRDERMIYNARGKLMKDAADAGGMGIWAIATGAAQ